MIQTYAFEPEIASGARSGRKRIDNTTEGAPELQKRFLAERPIAERALPGLRKGGA